MKKQINMGKEIMVTRSSLPPFEEYVNEIKPLWDTHWLTNMGEKHIQFEELLCEYLGVQNISLTVNGHQALEGILEVMDLEGEVITTPYTFISTTHALVRKGLLPVFCDINEEDFTIDVSKIESLITEKTCAILPVHVYGNICDVKDIQDIADHHHLKVIYDAAHAFGEKQNGVGVGNFGDASMFSFHATKVFNSIEGGAAVFSDEQLCKALDDWKNFGIVNEEEVDYIGGNAKMNEFSAAMGICNLRHIDDAIRARKVVDEKYRELLSDVPGLQLNVIQPDVERNYSYFPIVIHPEKFGCTRDDIFQKLAENNIHARKYFYPLTSDVDSMKGKYRITDIPVAREISNRVLTLPIYEGLALEDVERICDVVLSCRHM